MRTTQHGRASNRTQEGKQFIRIYENKNINADKFPGSNEGAEVHYLSLPIKSWQDQARVTGMRTLPIQATQAEIQ